MVADPLITAANNRSTVFAKWRQWARPFNARFLQNSLSLPPDRQTDRPTDRRNEHGTRPVTTGRSSSHSTTPTPIWTSSRGFSLGCHRVGRVARILTRMSMSVSVSWNSSFIRCSATRPNNSNEGRRPFLFLTNYRSCIASPSDCRCVSPKIVISRGVP